LTRRHMQTLSRASLVAAIMASFLASAAPALSQTASAPDFGHAPSGEIPILFNDGHVYATPDTLRSGRVLAALVRNGVIFVPLRSMFEQLGATVSWDEATRTADVAKTRGSSCP